MSWQIVFLNENKYNKNVSGWLNPEDESTFGCLSFPLLSVLMHLFIPGSLETLDVDAKQRAIVSSATL